MSQQGVFGLDIASGLIRHPDGTFGVYVLLGFTGWGDNEPLRNVFADESGAPVSFATEREAQIAAFDWMQDIRRDIMNSPYAYDQRAVRQFTGVRVVLYGRSS